MSNCNHKHYQGARVGVIGEIRPPGVPRGKWLCRRVDFREPRLVRENIMEIINYSHKMSTVVYPLAYVFFHHDCQSWLWILDLFFQLDSLVNEAQNHHCQEYCPAFSGLL